MGIDFLITSSNKCLHGVPGVALIYGRREALTACQGNADNVVLDLYQQWSYMEETEGAFRFTSPTHVLLALNEAVRELKEQGDSEIARATTSVSRIRFIRPCAPWALRRR